MNPGLLPWMKWHRWAGLAAAAFILMVSVTGIVLNHGAALGLARHYVQNPWLLDLYGIDAAPAPVTYAAAGHHVSVTAGRVYFDDRELPTRAETLLGAVALQDQLAVALPGRLLLLAMDGSVIETLGAAEGVPADLGRIGAVPGGGLVVEAGGRRFVPDLDTLRWDEADPAGVDWAMPVTLPADMARAVQAHGRAHTLTLERVLLDLHSGRIASRPGAWFMDGIALVLISLVISGLWIWLRR